MTVKKKVVPLGVAIGIGLNSMAAMSGGFTDLESASLVDLQVVSQEEGLLEVGPEEVVEVDRDDTLKEELYHELLRIHTEELGEIHSRHESEEEGYYSERSWSELERVMDYTETILEDFENKRDMEVSRLEMAIVGLNNAISNLERRQEEVAEDGNKEELRSRYEGAKASLDLRLIRDEDLSHFRSIEDEIIRALEEEDLTRDRTNELINSIEIVALNLSDYINYLGRLHDIIGDFNLELLEDKAFDSFTSSHDKFAQLMNELASLDYRDTNLGNKIYNKLGKLDDIISIEKIKYEEAYENLRDEFYRALEKAEYFLEYKAQFDYHNGTVENIRYQESVGRNILESRGPLKVLRNSITSIYYDLELFEGDLERSFFDLYSKNLDLVKELKSIGLSLDQDLENMMEDYGLYFNNRDEIYKLDDRIGSLYSMNIDLLKLSYNLEEIIENAPTISVGQGLLEDLNSFNRRDQKGFEELVRAIVREESMDIELDENTLLGLYRYGKGNYDSLDSFEEDLRDKYSKRDLMASVRDIGAITSNRAMYENTRTDNLIKLHDEAVHILRVFSKPEIINSKNREIRDLIKDIYEDRQDKIKEMNRNFQSFEEVLGNKEDYLINDAFKRLENLYNERTGLENGILKDIENVNANFDILFSQLDLRLDGDLEELNYYFYDLVEKNLHIIDMTEEEQDDYTEESFSRIIDLYEKIESIFEGDLGQISSKELRDLIDQFESALVSLEKKEQEDLVKLQAIDRLKESVEKARESLREGIYTEESSYILVEKIREAENIIENSHSFQLHEIEDMWKSIYREIEEGLEKIDLEEFVDLMNDIEKYILIIESENNIYTDQSSERLMEAYEILDDILNGKSTYREEELKNKKEKVLRAIEALELKEEEKPEVKPEAKPEVKPEAKPEVKPEAKPETKPEAKPETKPEVKPESKPNNRPNNNLGNNGNYGNSGLGNNKDNGNTGNNGKNKNNNKNKVNNNNGNKNQNKKTIKNQEKLNKIVNNGKNLSDQGKKSISMISSLSNTFNGIQSSMSKVMVKIFK